MKKMCAILNENFIAHPNILVFINKYLRCINGRNAQDDIFMASKITEKDLGFINEHYDAVLTRHNIDNAIIKNITIPVLCQHEFPYNHIYLGLLRDDVVYLTDKSYVHHFPKAAILPSVVESCAHHNIEDRKYDLLFTGRIREGKNELSSELFLKIKERLIQEKINSFDTVDTLVEFIRAHFSKDLLDIEENEFYTFCWSLLHALRNARRDILIAEIYGLARDGYKICMVVDTTRDALSPHKNIDVYYNLPYEKLELLARESKCVIVQTPMHFSTFNERFVLALESGAIPLCEPYPHYIDFFGLYAEDLIFDYDKNSLGVVFKKLLSTSADELIVMREHLFVQADKMLSPEKFKGTMFNLIKEVRG